MSEYTKTASEVGATVRRVWTVNCPNGAQRIEAREVELTENGSLYISDVDGLRAIFAPGTWSSVARADEREADAEAIEHIQPYCITAAAQAVQAPDGKAVVASNSLTGEVKVAGVASFFVKHVQKAIVDKLQELGYPVEEKC
jgi:hypothetical protein